MSCQIFIFIYRPKNAGEKDICCTPFSGTAKKPARLLAMEAESFKLRHEQFLVRDTYKIREKKYI